MKQGATRGRPFKPPQNTPHTTVAPSKPGKSSLGVSRADRPCSRISVGIRLHTGSDRRCRASAILATTHDSSMSDRPQRVMSYLHFYNSSTPLLREVSLPQYGSLAYWKARAEHFH